MGNGNLLILTITAFIKLFNFFHGEKELNMLSFKVIVTIIPLLLSCQSSKIPSEKILQDLTDLNTILTNHRVRREAASRAFFQSLAANAEATRQELERRASQQEETVAVLRSDMTEHLQEAKFVRVQLEKVSNPQWQEV